MEEDNPMMMAMEDQNSPFLDDISDDDDISDYVYSISDFLNYMSAPELSYWEPNSINCLRVFWSPDDESGHHQELPSLAETPTNDRAMKEKIKFVLSDWYAIPTLDCYAVFPTPDQFAVFPLLVQFWAPKTIGGRRFLTTEDQPFGLRKLHKGLCRYRKHCVSVRVDVDGGSEDEKGPIGRVFLQKLPETTPDVRYYRTNEYPLLDLATSCGVRGSWALPMLEREGHCCVGVLELLSTDDIYNTCASNLGEVLKTVDLRCSPMFCLRDTQVGGYFKNAFAEIDHVLKVVYKTYKLPFAQIWVPCQHSSDVAYGLYLRSGFGRCTGGDMPIHLRRSMWFASSVHHLQKEKGVGGRAFSSYKPYFCRDITKFSITEYPLVHHARKFGFKSCFAICLRQNSGPVNDVYVLEFFLPSSITDDRDPLALSNLILVTLKQNFRSFMLASGQELGEELFEEVEFSRDDEPCGTLGNGGETMQLDESTITVKATYGDGNSKIRFQLTSSSKIYDLEEKVIERLSRHWLSNLRRGMFGVKYKDDDGDWISLTCDDDLLYCMDSFRSSNRNRTHIEMDVVYL